MYHLNRGAQAIQNPVHPSTFIMGGYLLEKSSVLVLALVLFGCGSKERSPLTLDIRAVSHFTIGDDESAPSEYLFGRIEGIAADEAGNIYVADYAAARINVYNADGRFLRYLGGRGRGPGEFQRIRSIFTTPRGELIVVDGGARRITRMGLEGAVKSVAPFQDGIEPYQLIHWVDDQYLISDVSVDRFMRGKEAIFHVFDDHLKTHSQSFAQISDVGQSGTWDPVLHAFDLGSLVRIDNRRFLFAPWMYKGRLYEFTHHGTQWKRSGVLRGRASQSEPYERLTPTPSQQSSEFNIWTSTPIRGEGREELAFLIHNESRGLFRLDNGRLIHFTFLRRDDERVLGAEIFDSTGTLLGYGPVQGALPSPSPRAARSDAWTLPLKIWTKGPNDLFYIEDLSAGFPMVHVVTFEYNLGSGRE